MSCIEQNTCTRESATYRPSVLIVLLAGIGDLILASSAIRAVRNAYTNSEIHLLTIAEAGKLATYCPLIDHVHVLPVRQFRSNKRTIIPALQVMCRLRSVNFKLCMNLYRVSSFSGALKMGLLFSMLKADVKMGHDRYGFGRFLDVSLPASTFEGRHVVDAMQEIAIKAGGILDDRGIEVFWNPTAERKWSSFFNSMDGKIAIGINPGGDRSNRRWAPNRFAAVASRLVERFDARIVLLGGPGDRDIATSVEQAIPSAVSNLSGSIPLDELPYVISRLDLLVTNDSGPMHIAAATKTLLVALFGPEDPLLFGPYSSPRLYRVIQKDVPCRPCGNKKCAPPSCLDQITVDEVLANCFELIHI